MKLITCILVLGLSYLGHAQTITLTYDAYGNRLSKTVTGTYPKLVISGDSVVCQGDSAHLYASGGATYNWSNGRTGSSTSVPGDSTRTYALTAISAAGCSTTVYHRVSVTPVLVTGAISGDSVVYTTTKTNYTVPYHAGSFYEWGVSGGNIIFDGYGKDTVVIQWVGTPGTATVEVKETVASGKCGSQTVFKPVTIRQSTAVPEVPKAEANVSVYPNPASSGAWVKISLLQSGAALITITDELGRQLAQKRVSGKASYEVPLEQSLFPVPGIYFIHVNYGSGISTQKLQVK